jgi:hypothetical protein
MLPMAAENKDIELGLRNGAVGSVTGLDSARLGETPVKVAVRNGHIARNATDANSIYIQRKGTIESVRSGISHVASFVSFFRSCKACQFRQKISAKKGSVTHRSGQEPGPSLAEADIAARNAFFKVILHQDDAQLSTEEEAKLLSAACVEWYGKFLECRFRGAWTMVLREALRNLKPRFNEPQLGEIGTVYNFMSVVAKLLLEDGRKGLAISEISDEAGNLRMFKEDETDVERKIPNQLVFAAVGWLSKSPESF